MSDSEPAIGQIGLVCEGVTDQAVIMNILRGILPEGEYWTEPIQPPLDATSEAQAELPGGWPGVVAMCMNERIIGVLQSSRYVIVQVDSDRCDQEPFNITKCGEDGRLQPERIMDEMREAPLKRIGAAVPEHIRKRIIFAIAVENLECWLVPLWSDMKKKTVEQGCLDKLNKALTRKNKPGINPQDKSMSYYDELSEGYRKRKGIEKHIHTNASFRAFTDAVRLLIPPVE